MRITRPVAALLAAALAAAIVAGCGALGLGEEREGATPEGTVKAYLDASVVGDCRAASRLSTNDLVRQGVWCADPRVLSYGEIDDGEQIDRKDEFYFMVDGVVLGGTALEQLGLEAGENSILVTVLQQADGTWRVNSTNPRPEPPAPGP